MRYSIRKDVKKYSRFLESKRTIDICDAEVKIQTTIGATATAAKQRSMKESSLQLNRPCRSRKVRIIPVEATICVPNDFVEVNLGLYIVATVIATLGSEDSLFERDVLGSSTERHFVDWRGDESVGED